MKDSYIYLDYSATTPLRPEANKAMQPYFGDVFGNPSSIHAAGREALNAVDSARRSVAAILNCEPGEIVWTSGGTESDNLAILGIGRKDKPGHIVTSAIEHKAVLGACAQLEREGWKVTYVKPGRDGVLKTSAVLGAIKDSTRLVSIIYAQNEVGTIQPIREIGRGIQKLNTSRTKKVLFHTDAVQAGTLLDIDTKNLCVDMLSLSAHKLGGPKGTGILFVRSGIAVQPLLVGGGQEGGRRSGTLNVAAIVGMATALSVCQITRERETKRLAVLQKRLIAAVSKLPGVTLNGDVVHRLASNVNVSVGSRTSDELVIGLDRAGIGVSAASACSSGSIEPSYVLQAMGYKTVHASSSLRITMGYRTKAGDITKLVSALKRLI